MVDVVSVYPRSFAKPAPRMPEKEESSTQFQWHREGQGLGQSTVGLSARMWVPRLQPWQKARPVGPTALPLVIPPVKRTVFFVVGWEVGSKH